MFKIKLACLLILLLFTIGFLTVCSSTPEKTRPPTRRAVAYFPKMQVGDKWMIQNQTEKYYLEIVSVNPDGSFVRYSRKDKRPMTRKFYFNNKFQLVKVQSLSGRVIMKPEPLITTLDFPLFVGKRWETKYDSYSIGGRIGEYVEKFRVLSYETVKTPAGEFKAFKIRRSGSHTDSTDSSALYTTIEWYSPEVKIYVKKIHSDFSPMELVDYKLAGSE